MKYNIFRFLLLILLSSSIQASPQLDQKNLAAIHDYITHTWDNLRRTVYDCNSLRDKLTGSYSRLYLPAGLPFSEQLLALQEKCQIEIKYLPKIHKLGTVDVKKTPIGILFLPKPYVVPGGSFNEMYGWDSYFIMLGLIADNKLDYAEDMLENVFFEIEHYGAILNANRSYFLSRSQPPFLTSMIRAVYEAKSEPKQEWLANAYRYAVKDYHFWTSAPHLAGNTGLSRYYDFATGPAPEFNLPENHYYTDVARELNTTLDDHFYAGDRAMRESGLDTSFRFGAFSAHTTDYAPVDLNSLLYKAEQDLAWMADLLNRPEDAKKWRLKSDERLKRINQYLWNEKQGMYFDYDFTSETQSHYVYLSTYYPLWAGAASQEQAKSVEKHLNLFEQKGGLLSSPYRTGAQWDAPYGWAPLQYLTVQGLKKYHYDTDANRIAYKFTKMVLDNFMLEHTIREKYDVIHASYETDVKFGYIQNMVGFGWTNAVFLKFLE